MICNELEYQSAVAHLDELRLVIRRQAGGSQDSEVFHEPTAAKVDYLQSACRRLEDDVAAYERRTAQTWVPDL